MSLATYGARAYSAEIWLKVGETRTLKAPGSSPIKIGQRGVVRVIDAGDNIRIIGLKPGATTVSLEGVSHLVRVSLSAQKDFIIDLRNLLKKLMGLKLSTDSARVEVRGTLLRFSDWLAIADLSRRHGGEYVFRAKAFPDVGVEALTYLRELSHQHGFPIIRFSAQPEFTAHLPHGGSALKKSAQRHLAPFGIQLESSPSELTLQPLVRTRVILAEVAKSFSHTLGMRWPAEYTAQILPRLQKSQDLLLTLKALEAEGQAQILASPNLLCRSGGQARFHAGGEFPVQTLSRHSKSIHWKSHGVILNVKPKADFLGAMSLEIETEVSSLDMANAVEGVPAVKKSSVRSHFDLPGRRTIVLSGLLRQESGKASEGLPFLNRVPFLGAMFGSKTFLKHQSELVIFVTPEIYSPAIDEPLTMPEGWLQNEF